MKNIIILLILISNYSFSQKHQLGKVTIQELEEKVCPIDSSAAASILFTVSDVYFNYDNDRGFVLTINVKTKIKIYKKEGYDWANKSVNYYIGNISKERLSFDNEVTYNLVNGKIEKTKLKSDGEFEEKVNDFWARKKISMPNVKEGSIIEYEYTIVTDLISTINKWNFESSIPTIYNEYKIRTPEYYVYKPALRGFITPKIVSEKNQRAITISSKNRSSGYVTQTTFNNENINFNETKTVYSLENIPAVKDEAFVNNIENYIISVEHELISIQYPNQPFKNFATDWETVVRKIYENDDFGNELNKSGYYEKDIDVILSGITSQEERINAIFTFVKSKMNWNDFYGYSCRNGVKKAYQEKTGNVAEINLILTSMLRYAGFVANPILVSTRGNGISMFPSRNAYDYVITGIELQNQVVLLDATNKYSLPNILPIRDLNWFGRIIRKDGSSEQIDLMPKIISKEMINLMVEINDQGEVKGKIRDQYLDYNAFRYRDNFNVITNESMVERIEKNHNGLEISDYNVQNKTELSKPIIESYSFTSNNSVEIIGDKMYFSPLLHFAMTENPFKQEKRQYPIDFVFPSQDKYSISIKIPDGYVVETLPVSKALGLPDDAGNFKYSISNNGNQIQVMYSIDINAAIISSDMYDAVKAFFKEMVMKQTEKVVLKKG